uniref:ATP synthase complex subunit 8 n=1 Tax=Sinodendron yunnanense TaxID=618637 RepID=A0A342D3U5_9SCAR|nr:ATP synthase F0 subunit 8 [Sinodendron yunnanense]AKN01375.1 ATP synthase F0 subunit 8 [Sinodendron yunnanense]
MPQMAPMNWLILFFLFIITFIIFNSLNYFSFIYSPKLTTFKKKMSKLNWKW